MEPQPDAEPQPYAEPEPTPESTPIPGTQQQTYIESEPEPTPEPAPIPSGEPQIYAEPGPEPTPEPTPVASVESQSYTTEPEATPETAPIPSRDPQIYAEPEPQPTPEPAARPDQAPGPDSSASSPMLEPNSEEHSQSDAAYEGRSVDMGIAAEVVIGVPTNAKECLHAGGECIPTDECPNAEFGWNQPFKGICGREGYDCCFKGESSCWQA